MERYIFSGSMTQTMWDYLLAMPDFEPLNILVTQVDRSGVKKAIEYKQKGWCQFFMLDSGAFSIHCNHAHTTPDEYIDYLNSIDEYVDVAAQLDTIPGKFGQPKTPQDYQDSADKSWENFLYMIERVKSPKKVMPVFHFGEAMEALGRILDFRYDDGTPLDYICISPANDATMDDKNVYLTEVNDYIANSSNPNVKTHLLGYTSLDGLSKYKCYSADSISHRHIAGYAKVLSPAFGVISVSKKERSVMNKSSLSFIDTAGPEDLETFRKELAECNLTIEQIQDDSNARVAFTMHSILKLCKTKYVYHPQNKTRSTLFLNMINKK